MAGGGTREMGALLAPLTIGFWNDMWYGASKNVQLLSWYCFRIQNNYV